jgi:hypothetical protein
MSAKKVLALEPITRKRGREEEQTQTSVCSRQLRIGNVCCVRVYITETAGQNARTG